METIRTFIALPLPPSVRDALENLIRRMRPLAPGVKWVRVDSIHLTLKFLGNLKPGEVDGVFNVMDKIFENSMNNMEFSISHTGVFPAPKKPRVLWVGLDGAGMVDLRRLQGNIESKMEEIGFPREDRQYSPHLTVGRVKFLKNPVPFMEEFLRYSFPKFTFVTDRVLIMRSILKPEGPQYSIQKTYMLSGFSG